jgi:hypothetical protein
VKRRHTQQGIVERGRATSEAEQQPRRLTDTPVEVIARKTYLDCSEAAVHTCRKTVNAFRKWARSRAVPPIHDGRRVLYRRKDVERALEQGARFAGSVIAERKQPHGGQA